MKSKSQAKRIAAQKSGKTSDIYDDLFVGDPGTCSDCGEKWEWVRPGKSQPICDCHETCPIHGRNKIVYHEEGEFKNISGYFCGDCEREFRKEILGEQGYENTEVDSQPR